MDDGMSAPPATFGASSHGLRGDYRGQWLNITTMRFNLVFSRPPDAGLNSVIGQYEMTSELSNAVYVSP